MVGSVVVTLLLFTHCTTEHGRMLLPVTVNVSAGPPAGTLVWESATMEGAGSAAGVNIVNGSELEVPNELDTVTFAEPENAVSVGGIAAVSWVALTNVVARGEPFQFTTASLVKFVPVTVSVRPAALQYGVEFCEVVDAESLVMVGAGPGVGLMVKRT